MDLASQAKEYWTTNHNQNGRLIREGHEHRWELARHILEHSPKSALEFGCGSGRNLAVLQDLAPDLGLTGIDANKVSLESGRQHHPDIGFIYGDEKTLEAIKPNSHDVVFTVSVLDHIPNPEWRAVYDNLKRIASKAVVLLEPIMWGSWDYHKVMVEYDFAADSDLKPTDYTWAHDYDSHDPKLEVIRSLPIALGGNWQKFGDTYTLMESVLS